jgi:deoxyribose-phosphate aldolase
MSSKGVEISHDSSPVALKEWQSVARIIDHTLLRPEAAKEQVIQICREALQYSFASVCVNPCYVTLASSMLRGSQSKVCTVIGFPLGATLTTIKRLEAFDTIRLGADELDMVLNVGALKAGDHGTVQADIRAVAEVTHDSGSILKVILETALLTAEEKTLACELSVTAGADFVKTSTGFSTGGATRDDVALMRRVVGNRARVKASGGIRTAADVAAMVSAGADRIGASASVAIVRELGAP